VFDAPIWADEDWKVDNRSAVSQEKSKHAFDLNILANWWLYGFSFYGLMAG